MNALLFYQSFELHIWILFSLFRFILVWLSLKLAGVNWRCVGAQAKARGQEQDRWRPNHAENEAFGGMEEENEEEERSRQMRGRHTWDLTRLEQNQLHCFISLHFGDEPSPPASRSPLPSVLWTDRLTEADSGHCTKKMHGIIRKTIIIVDNQQKMQITFETGIIWISRYIYH